MDKMDKYGMDLEKVNIERLKEIFPECVTDGKVNFDALRKILGDDVETSGEKYSFNWVGKSDAMKIALMPSTGTLRPCKDKSKDWDKTENLYIEGDNLEVLKTLEKTYHNQIKMIYIDPPYNTGKDFVYHDDFHDNVSNYLENSAQAFRTNPETAGRFHTDWLNMMYPRLKIARELLKEEGAVFISIDDNEVTNLKKICDEIFGEENFVAIFPWRKRTAKSDVPFGVSQDFEWIVCYAKTGDFKAFIEGGTRKYYETPDFPGRPWRIHDMTKQTTASERPNSFFTMVNPKTGEEYPCDPNRTWRITKDTFQRYYDANEIVFPGDYPFLRISKPVARYFKDKDMEKMGDNFGKIAVSTKLPDDIGMSQDGTKEMKEIFGCIPFSFPKSVKYLKYLIKIATDNDSIILDFFSGSATTAHAVMDQNFEDGGKRKFILVQLPEKCDENTEAFKAGYNNICEIGEERIRRAGNRLESLNKARKNIPQVSLFDGVKHVDEYDENYDTGFKVFKLDSTNIKPWDATVKYDETTIFDLQDSVVKKDRSNLDIAYEVMLKYGIFNMPLEEKEVNGKTVYSVGEGYMIISLNDEITTEDVAAIAALGPKAVVFKESGFVNDNAKMNADYTFKRLGIDNVKCI